MTPSQPSPRSSLPDALGGVALLAVGLFFFLTSFRYGIGTLIEMGPGFFPMILGAVTSVLALGIVLWALIGRGEVPDPPDWRPFLGVVASIAAFGLTIDSLGLLPASVLVVLLVGLGDRGARLLPTLGLAATVCLVSWLVFTVGLGLPIPLIRAFS